MAIILTDFSGNGNTLTNNGGAEVTGLFAASTTAVDFETTESDYMTAIDSASLSLSGDFTIEFWIKAESLAATMGIVTKSDRDPTQNKKGYRIGITTAGDIFIEINETADDTTRDVVTWTLGLSTGVAYHVAISCDISEATATTFILYLDSVSQGNGTASVSGNCASINNNDIALHIGSEFNTGAADRFFDGIIDDVRIWSVVRTATEIANNYTQVIPASPSNAVGYYPFETPPAAGGNPMFFSGGITIG